MWKVVIWDIIWERIVNNYTSKNDAFLMYTATWFFFLYTLFIFPAPQGNSMDTHKHWNQSYSHRPQYSKYSLQTNITWDLVGNAESRAPSQTYRLRICILTRSLDDSSAHCLRSTDFKTSLKKCTVLSSLKIQATSFANHYEFLHYLSQDSLVNG